MGVLIIRGLLVGSIVRSLILETPIWAEVNVSGKPSYVHPRYGPTIDHVDCCSCEVLKVT